MGNLPIWALWPVTIAVWASPGLAILSARSIARLLHRVQAGRGGTYRESARALTGDPERPGVRPVDDQDRRLSVDYRRLSVDSRRLSVD